MKKIMAGMVVLVMAGMLAMAQEPAKGCCMTPAGTNTVGCAKGTNSVGCAKGTNAVEGCKAHAVGCKACTSAKMCDSCAARKAAAAK